MSSHQKGNPYLGMTCHGVSKPFKFFSSSLCCKNFSLSHTGENIFVAATNTLEDFNIDDKLFKCVHDNGANIVKANQLSMLDLDDNQSNSEINETEKEENELIDIDFNEILEANIDIDEEVNGVNSSQTQSIDSVAAEFFTSLNNQNFKSNRCFDHTLQLVIKDSKGECFGVVKTMKKIFCTASKSHIVHAFVKLLHEKGI